MIDQFIYQKVFWTSQTPKANAGNKKNGMRALSAAATRSRQVNLKGAHLKKVHAFKSYATYRIAQIS